MMTNVCVDAGCTPCLEIVPRSWPSQSRRHPLHFQRRSAYLGCPYEVQYLYSVSTCMFSTAETAPIMYIGYPTSIYTSSPLISAVVETPVLRSTSVSYLIFDLDLYATSTCCSVSQPTHSYYLGSSLLARYEESSTSQRSMTCCRGTRYL